MTPAEQLRADLAARVASQRRVVDEMLRQKREGGLTAKEKRGIAAMVAKVVAFVARLVG